MKLINNTSCTQFYLSYVTYVLLMQKVIGENAAWIEYLLC